MVIYNREKQKMTKQKTIQIFKGKTDPSTDFVGVENKKKDTKDKFGNLYRGNVRGCYIDTKWGQLTVPYNWIGKHIKIIVSIHKEEENEKL